MDIRYLLGPFDETDLPAENLDEQLTLTLQRPGQSPETKTIFPLAEDEAEGYVPLQRVLARSYEQAAYEAFATIPELFERAGAYRLGTLDEADPRQSATKMLSEGQPLVAVDFFETEASANAPRRFPNYPGIEEQIVDYDNAVLPACTHCGSYDTAVVSVGVIGRSMTIGAWTRKFKLRANDKPAEFYCNRCETYFDAERPEAPAEQESAHADEPIPGLLPPKWHRDEGLFSEHWRPLEDSEPRPEQAEVIRLLVAAWASGRELDPWLPFPQNGCIFGFGDASRPLPIGALRLLWSAGWPFRRECPHCRGQIYTVGFGGLLSIGGFQYACADCGSGWYQPAGGAGHIATLMKASPLAGTGFHIGRGLFGGAVGSDGAELRRLLGATSEYVPRDEVHFEICLPNGDRVDDSRGHEPLPFACGFGDLNLPLLAEWFELGQESRDISIEAEPDLHLEATLDRHEAAWTVDVRLARYEGPDADFAGAISFSMSVDVIYGPPLTIEFLKKFRARERHTKVRWAWANRSEKPGAMMTFTFELRHEMAPGDTVTYETVGALAGQLVDETYEGIVETEMGWIFSRRDAL